VVSAGVVVITVVVMSAGEGAGAVVVLVVVGVADGENVVSSGVVVIMVDGVVTGVVVIEGVVVVAWRVSVKKMKTTILKPYQEKFKHNLSNLNIFIFEWYFLW
jgi:hypothetical protein